MKAILIWLFVLALAYTKLNLAYCQKEEEEAGNKVYNARLQILQHCQYSYEKELRSQLRDLCNIEKLVISTNQLLLDDTLKEFQASLDQFDQNYPIIGYQHFINDPELGTNCMFYPRSLARAYSYGFLLESLNSHNLGLRKTLVDPARPIHLADIASSISRAQDLIKGRIALINAQRKIVHSFILLTKDWLPPAIDYEKLKEEQSCIFYEITKLVKLACISSFSLSAVRARNISFKILIRYFRDLCDISGCPAANGCQPLFINEINTCYEAQTQLELLEQFALKYGLSQQIRLAQKSVERIIKRRQAQPCIGYLYHPYRGF